MAEDRFRDLRKEYASHGLDIDDVVADPIEQFRLWFDAAAATDLHEPNAMTLATSTAEGRPSARMVLLKSFDERGFVFYTNYHSRKAQELADSGYASLVFWWGPLERQIRIEGAVEKVSVEESDAYYQSRPFGSRLGAWVSPQSEVISGRELLEERLQELQEKYQTDAQIPRPEHWGGYRVKPDRIEFWQGGAKRLHDRLKYERNGNNSWNIVRLAP